MLKRYSPVQVRNPSSLQHLVRVKQGQEIVLHLDSDLYQNPTVECSTDLLKITHQEGKSDRRIYHIAHPPSVHEWSEYSQCFLGEVWIDYDKAITKLSVMLECVTPSKQNFVSIANPDCVDLRLLPHNVLEVVVFDLSFGYQDEWYCEWIPHVDGLTIIQLGNDQLCLNSWNQYWDYAHMDSPQYEYAKYPRVDISQSKTSDWSRQHHFWFRFGGHVDKVADSIGRAIKHVGDLKIHGKNNRFLQTPIEQQKVVAIFMDCRKVRQGLLDQVAAMKTKNETSPYTHQGWNSHKKQKKQKKRSSFGPLVHDVEVTLLDRKFEDCSVKSARPAWSGSQGPLDDPYGYEDDPDDYYFPQGNRIFGHRMRID